MFRRFNFHPYLILVLAPIILFSPILITGKALFWGTPSTQFIPWWQTAWETILDGQLPLWNAWLGMGAPLLANYQSALLYPPTWAYLILWLVGGTPAMAWGMALIVVIHLIWAGFGMAFLVRHLRLGLLPQVVAGLAYSLSGYLVARAGFLSINATTSWTPWVILGASLLAEQLVSRQQGETSLSGEQGPLGIRGSRKVWMAGIFLGMCAGMLLLAGHAQSAWYTLVFAGVWGVFRLDLAHRQISGNGLTIKLTLKYGLIFMLVLCVALSLAAVQLLPTVEYLLQSQRSTAVDFEYAMTYSFWPWHALTLFAPGLFGSPAGGDYWGYANYWEDAVYIGLTPIILALLAILTRFRRSRLVIFLSVTIFISFLIALGKNTPVFPWLYRYIPTFDMFQAPTRINLIVIFSLAVLAAIGASVWRRPGRRGLYWARLGTMAAAAVTAGAFLASLVAGQVLKGIEPSLIQATALAGLWGVGLGFLTLTAPERPEEQFTTGKNLLWSWAVVIWVAADLVIAGWGLNPGVDLDFYRSPSQSAETVRELAGDGRLYLPAEDEEVLKFDWLFRFNTFTPLSSKDGWDILRSALLPNTNSLDHIPSANNYDPLLPGRYVTWMKTLNEAAPWTRENLLNLMAVSVVEIMNAAKPFEVGYISRHSLPRARWVPCGISAQGNQDALEALLQGLENLEQVVWLEAADVPSQADCNPGQTADITIAQQQSNMIVIDTSTQALGYVVLANMWYPGWTARLDSHPVKIYRANYLFQAVEVPAGNHRLVLAYRPAWFFVGLGISSLALIGTIGLNLYVRRFST